MFLLQNVMISTPSDLEYEQYIFEKYLGILILIDAKINSETTIEDDEKMLSLDELSWQVRMCVTYRLEKKRYLESECYSFHVHHTRIQGHMIYCE